MMTVTNCQEKSMKKVILIGDSIRLGYCPFVRERLRNMAEVFYPDDNCRFTQYTYVNLKNWLSPVEPLQDVSLIHWNNGHWDIARWDGDGASLNTVENYCGMLERIYARLTAYCPKATIIFALTTPMNPDGSMGANPRTNAEIATYNEAAKRTMEKLGVEVNDLFTLMQSQPASFYIDSVHYTQDGYKILADAVAQRIQNHIG
jgi:lysophospholipase L1-like esterase